jgi:hypothetical protein
MALGHALDTDAVANEIGGVLGPDNAFAEDALTVVGDECTGLLATCPRRG